MVLWYVMALLAEGLIVGVLAQSVVPELSVPDAVGLALVGSFLGGVIAWLFIGHSAGVVFAAIGATALVYTRRRFVESR